MPHAIADECGYRQHLEIVGAAELDELRHARHGAVLIHDLADHTSGHQACQTRQIH
jgi:hypothetical protein